MLAAVVLAGCEAVDVVEVESAKVCADRARRAAIRTRKREEMQVEEAITYTRDVEESIASVRGNECGGGEEKLFEGWEDG